jgi:hypothetical protein
MLDRFIRNQSTLDRLGASPFAAQLNRFATALLATEYCRETGHRYPDATGHLGDWCSRRGIELHALDGRIVAQFVAHLDACTCSGEWRQQPRDAAAGARRFLA